MTEKQAESLHLKRDEERLAARLAMGADIFAQTPRTGASKLPADPEGQNDDRAEWAEHAVIEFIGQTGVDEVHSAIGDLLANLMHLCDRLKHIEFDEMLRMARCHYEEETYEEANDE